MKIVMPPTAQRNNSDDVLMQIVDALAEKTLLHMELSGDQLLLECSDLQISKVQFSPKRVVFFSFFKI